MEGKKTYWKINIGYGIWCLLFGIVLIGTPCVYSIKFGGRIVCPAVFSMYSAFLCFSVFLLEILAAQKNEKCNWISEKNYYERAVCKRKISRRNLMMHIMLLQDYIELGEYEKCPGLLEKIQNYKGYISDSKKIRIGLLKIHYEDIMEDEYLLEHIGELDRELKKGGHIGRIDMSVFSDEIQTLKYRASGEYGLLVDYLLSHKGSSVYAQVRRAYLLGEGYLALGQYDRAFGYLSFASEYGGNTKYAAWAGELMGIVPEKDRYSKMAVGRPEKNRPMQSRMRSEMLAGLMMVFLFVAANLYFLQGNSPKEAYCRNYAKGVVETLYQQDSGAYEIVLFSDSDNIAYCIFEKKDYGRKRIYITKDIRFENMKNEEETLYKFNEFLKNDGVTYNDILIRGQMVFTMNLYRENRKLLGDSTKFVGITLLSPEDRARIGGKSVKVEGTINVNGRELYLWSVEGVDMDNYRFGDVVIEGMD